MPEMNTGRTGGSQPNRMMLRRTLFLLIVCGIVAFIVLGARLYKLQVVDHDLYESEAIAQQVRSTTITASRGAIYDRNGKILAMSASAQNVFISPAEIVMYNEDPVLIAKGLAEILGVDYGEVMEKTTHTKSYYQTIAQRVEQDWFGKPCGLMDQLAVSLGGLAYMDFRTDEPVAEKLAFDFGSHGYALVLTDVGCDHSAYTDEYAAVPTEMKAVAQAFGRERLCEVEEAVLLGRVPELRQSLGDRAVLRALHYYQEMELVDARWDALQAGNTELFLALTERSGASSAMFLQNVSVGGSERQDCMVAIVLSERILAGRGATRIHGGGFGGSIQAFVPVDVVDEYVTRMNSWLGEDAAKVYAISSEGAQAQWL